MRPAIHIRPNDLRDPRIAAFLEEHLADMRRTSPPESVHALDLEGLRRPNIQFWAGWIEGAQGTALAATAALKRIDATHGELKSLRTTESLRGQGIARRMLAYVIAHARAEGLHRLSLETGSQAFFAPARALYLAHGFEVCGPFDGYGPDANSTFMTLRL